MQDAPAPDGQDATLRFLRILVTSLTVTMIAGLITVVAVFVIRFPSDNDGTLIVPDKITLPAGEQASAVTQGKGWVAIVTESGNILVFDGRTGALRDTFTVK